MSSIILCNTGSDSLSKISLNDYDVKRVSFTLCDKPVGPHGIKVYGKRIITANTYNDSVSFFNADTLKEEKNFKVGPKPNDIIVIENRLYTICGESNAVVVYDMIDEKVICEICTGSWPHNIEFYSNKNMILVSNLESNSITVISKESYDVIKTISTPEYPTRLKVSNDRQMLYVCESYLGNEKDGYLDIFSLKDFSRIKRIKLGTSPIDLCEDDENIYISNFTDGSISIVDKEILKVKNTLYVGGMPKGIIKNLDNLYVADYLKGRLIVIENYKKKKVIAIEAEPNAMTLF